MADVKPVFETISDGKLYSDSTVAGLASTLAAAQALNTELVARVKQLERAQFERTRDDLLLEEAIAARSGT